MTTATPSTIEVPGVKGRERPRIRGFRDGSELFDLDFGRSSRPSLVTAILDRALDAHTSSADMPLTWRIAFLLGLWRHTSSIDPEYYVVCPGCEEELELLLSLSDLLAEAAGWELPPTVTVGPDHVEIRLPTGSDLERWAREGGATDFSDLGAADVASDEAGAALSEADPLVDFALDAKCPECGHRLRVPIDLETEALRGLESARDNLLREVHVLALAYSWTEKQVLGIPPERRRRYLELLDEGEGR